MIVASVSIAPSEDALRELRAAGIRQGLGPGRIITRGHVNLAAWPAHGASIDSANAIVWTGVRDSSVEASVSAAGRSEGNYSLLSESNGALLAARSQFGGRPLYYGISRETRNVYACSRLAPLMHLLGGTPIVDVERLAAHVILSDAEDPHATVFKGVRRVLPGESILFAPEAAPRSSRSALVMLETPKMTDDDWADAIRAEIEGAVGRATSGSVRPALFASGGLDSSALLASLVRRRDSGSERPPRVTALTLDFDAQHSDRPYFDALVRALPADPIRITPSECAHHAFPAMVMDGAPRCWPTNAMDVELLTRASSLGADRVLTGIGGDFFWDMEFDSIGERAVRGDWLAATREALRLKATYWMPSPLERVRMLVLRPILRSFVPRFARSARLRRAQRALKTPTWAGPALRRFLLRYVERCLDGAERLKGREARMADVATGATLADVADSMAQVEAYVGAVESHVFLDVRLARFLASIPSEVVLSGGWGRGVLRMAFRDAWPRMIVERPDKGEFEPAIAVANEGLRASGHLERLAAMRALGDLGLVEPAEVRATFARAFAGPGPGGELIAVWPLLALEAFASGLHASGRAWSAA